MIKIIKPSISEKIREITCTNPKCQAVLSYTDNDVKYNYGTQWDPIVNEHHYIKCPCCGEFIDIEWRR